MIFLPDETPMIRDMTAPCKGCLYYGFPDSINKNGLCSRCEQDGVRPKDPVIEDGEDHWNGW